MEFLQKHYEKILLSAVLVGLAVAAAWLPTKVSSLREEMRAFTERIIQTSVKPLPALEMQAGSNALKRLEHPERLPLAEPGHNVFNPIKWMRKGDQPMPTLELGLNALMVTKITPLNLVVEYKGQREASETPRYQFQVTREAATNTALQHPTMRICAVGTKNEIFALKDVRGAKEDPTEFLLELLDLKTNVWVAKDQPLSLVAGYSADLRCDPEGKSFPKQRPGARLTLAGAAYKIVAIGPATVTLEDGETKKRTTKRLPGAPQ